MFVVIGIMLLGVVLGVVLRGRPLSLAPRLITVLIWLLLFVLGLEVGANGAVMSSLPTLGLEAVLIALFCVLGSVSAAFLLWRFIRHKYLRQ